MTDIDLILETERLILRKWEPTDLQALHVMYSDPEMMRYIGTGRAANLAETQFSLDRMSERQEKFGMTLWPIIEREGGELIGRCGVQHLGDTGDIEIGWMLAKNWWGMGYATETAQACLEYGHAKLGLKCIVAIIHPENAASIIVALKIGLIPDGQIDWQRQMVNYYIGEHG